MYHWYLTLWHLQETEIIFEVSLAVTEEDQLHVFQPLLMCLLSGMSLCNVHVNTKHIMFASCVSVLRQTYIEILSLRVNVNQLIYKVLRWHSFHF